MARLPYEDADDNNEQREEDQAQDVAGDALDHTGDPSEDSERSGSDRTAVLPDDVPDLVDTMNAMVRSGQIDNGAYAGEPSLDDEDDGDDDEDDDA
jgi:hypothetical protein